MVSVCLVLFCFLTFQLFFRVTVPFYIVLTEIINKPIYSRNRKEFYLSQTEAYSPGDMIQEALKLCSTGLQVGEAYKGKNHKIT